MKPPEVSIVMRSFNEGWALRQTLPAVRAQEFTGWELIVIDSGSTDGSCELIRAANPAHFIQIKPGEYNPSRVLNHGMRLARAELIVFLNADATPQGPDWLRPLAEALRDPMTAAVFGRQIPRPDCSAVYAHDYDRCFGSNRQSARWEHFFSMVSSGLRKDIWSKRGFREEMQYSEDDEYTRWCREQGYRVVYVPDSVVMHSHNYTPRQAYKRSFGEAKALAAVWNRGPEEINWPRTVLLGWLNDLRRDIGYCRRSKRLAELPHAARIRWEQRRARLAGFKEGWRFYNRRPARRPFHPLKPMEQANFKQSNSQRFTLDGSLPLENRLRELCDEIRDAALTLVPREKLEALILGGGYGRGHGGVLRIPEGDAPYNDLEFYVFLRGNVFLNQARYRGRFHELGEALSPKAGLHVEFKIDSLEKLRRSPVSIFSYDLVSGYKVIHGSESVFAECGHHRDAGRIAPTEATRLLLNRGSGLLLAKELLLGAVLTDDQSDFIGRNLAKAKLALGDALLAAEGCYHWDCRERERRLIRVSRKRDWPFGAEVLEHHQYGVEFKLHPRRVVKSSAEFATEHSELTELALQVWLWVENRRLKSNFSTLEEYSLSRVEKCAGESSWRNLLLNVRTFGATATLDENAPRYPRERLFNALPLLLASPDGTAAPGARRHLQRQLHTQADDWLGLVAAYKQVWNCYG